MSKSKSISATEAAKIANVTPETIRNLCKAGTLAYTKRGNLFYPLREDVIKYKETIEEIHQATEDIYRLKDTLIEQVQELNQRIHGQRMRLVDIEMFPKRIEAIGKTLAAAMERYNQEEAIYQGQVSEKGVEFMIEMLKGSNLNNERGMQNDPITRERARQIWLKALRVYAYSRNEFKRLNSIIDEQRETIKEQREQISDLKMELTGERPPAKDDRIAKLLDTSLRDYALSSRCQGNLEWQANIQTLRDLVQYQRADLLKFRNFGRKSLTELDELLDSLGLHFGMDVTNYPKSEKGGAR